MQFQNHLKKQKLSFTALTGLFIPAHIDRTKNSIYSQLGFLPEDMKADALEISEQHHRKFADAHPEIKKFPVNKKF